MTEIIVNRLETHDRLIEFNKQAESISRACQECINNRPEEFKDYTFYIYAHCRTHDNGYQKRLIWQPRLKKPKATTNSMLFKVMFPGPQIKPVWMIPDRDQWDAYKIGTMFENTFVLDSIDKFIHHRHALENEESDEVSEELANQIYRSMGRNYKQRLEQKKVSEIARIKAMEIQ